MKNLDLQDIEKVAGGRSTADPACQLATTYLMISPIWGPGAMIGAAVGAIIACAFTGSYTGNHNASGTNYNEAGTNYN